MTLLLPYSTYLLFCSSLHRSKLIIYGLTASALKSTLLCYDILSIISSCVSTCGLSSSAAAAFSGEGWGANKVVNSVPGAAEFSSIGELI